MRISSRNPTRQMAASRRLPRTRHRVSGAGSRRGRAPRRICNVSVGAYVSRAPSVPSRSAASPQSTRRVRAVAARRQLGHVRDETCPTNDISKSDSQRCRNPISRHSSDPANSGRRRTNRARHSSWNLQSQSPSKPPRLTVDPSKEGVQAGVEAAKSMARLANSRPPRKSTPGPKRGTEESATRIRTVLGAKGQHVDGYSGAGSIPPQHRDLWADAAGWDCAGADWCQPVVPQETTATRRRLPAVVVRARPQDVTWGQVLAESKVVLFPELAVKVQPRGRTLVNLDTIVYTDESKVSTTTITLLGFPSRLKPRRSAIPGISVTVRRR